MESANSVVPIAQIKIGERFRKDLGNLIPLAQSIREIGLLHPVVVDSNFNLISGYRRIKAVQTLGWFRIPVHIVELKDLLKGEFHENVLRKDFTPSEMVAIKRYFEPEVKAEAEKRQEATQFGSSNLDAPLDSEKGRTDSKMASLVGIGKDTLRKAEDIVEAAEKEPEKFAPLLEKVDNGQISINAAHIQINRARKHTETPELPEGEFDVIYADPPWQYEVNHLRGSPENNYPTMPTDEICALLIPSSENAVLFLWATNPLLEDALRVMESWGFKYKTNMVWVKDHMGVGFWFRGQHELLLIGVKGDVKPPEQQNRFPSYLNVPTREHSQKPDEVYGIIESMFPDTQARLELFARNNREGWEVWGNEV